MTNQPPALPPPDPEQERRRLARLKRLAVLDTEPEPVFDALVRVAAAVCNRPIALLSLVDESRQWFKAREGLPGVTETPRANAFCDHVIRAEQVFEITDASRDPRFDTHPLVTGAPKIRSYAGVPITMPAGERIGTLCVVDPAPGTLTERQQAALRDLAQVAQALLLQREQLHGGRAASADHAPRERPDGSSVPLPPQPRKDVRRADASAASLPESLDERPDLGKLEAGRGELEDTPFRLDELLAQLGESYQRRAREKSLRFELEVAPEVPTGVSGDAGRLRQILDHLLSNALKFTAQGDFGLLVGRTDGARGPDMVRFTVHDTGIGIPYDVQKRLFRRFSQAERSTARHDGAGLGLAIVQQLTEQMGGVVLLQSEPGRGASFRCELPLRPTYVPPTVLAGRAATADNRGLRILVAEDNPTSQVVVRGLLAQAGYRDVTVVDDGRQAVDAGMSGDFDLVLMDCRMPGMDGYTASATLRERGFSAPIIALTANAAAGERERCLACGMNDYLAKPVDASRLALALGAWTTTAGNGDPMPPPASTGAPAAGATTFRRDQALRQLGGDEELLAVTLASFRQHAPQVLRSARDAAAAGLVADLHRHLHSLAASSAMVGAEPLRRLAQELEVHAQDGRAAEAGTGLRLLAQLLDEYLTASAAW